MSQLFVLRYTRAHHQCKNFFPLFLSAFERKAYAVKNLKMQWIEYDDYSLILNIISLLLPQRILIIVGVTNSDN